MLYNWVNYFMVVLFVVVMWEWKCSYEGVCFVIGSFQQCIDWVMDVIIQCEVEWFESCLLILVIVGFVVLFIGLFGIVWGIMIVFQVIVVLESINFVVVVLGIVEVFLVIVLGLVVVILVVIVYNKFNVDVGKVVVWMEGFVDEFLVILLC